MTESFWLWGHISFVLISTILLAPLFRRLPTLRAKSILVVGLAILGTLPAGKSDLAGFVVAHTSALSSPFLLLLMWRLLVVMNLATPASSHEQRVISWGVLGLGVFLYPAALGFVTFDSYRLGYHWSFGLVVLALSALAALKNYLATGICLAFAVLTWKLKLHESVNLWDYLIDPWLFFWSLGQIAGFVYRVSFRKPPSREGHLDTSIGAP